VAVLSTHRLRILSELRRRGTLGKVAVALTYSPSAISQQLALLEHEVGAKLVEPVGRGVRLTPQGELLADHAERILRDVEEAEAALSVSRRTTAGRFRMAVFQTAALTVMPMVLTELRRKHPGLTVRLAEFQPEFFIPALIAYDYDLVLGVEYEGQELPRDESVDQEDLLRDPIAIVTSTDTEVAAGSGAGSLRDLEHAPWVMESVGKAGRRWAQGICRRAGFEPDVRFESDDYIVHGAIVSAGHAVGMLPRLLLSRHDSTRLRTIELPGSPTRRVFTAVRAGASDRPAIKAIRLALRTATPSVDKALTLATG
jgi:DNA-binding transcriptional LysR family regulator